MIKNCIPLLLLLSSSCEKQENSNQAAIKELNEKIAAIDESKEEMPSWSNTESKPSMIANESNARAESVEIKNEKKSGSNKEQTTSKATEKLGFIVPSNKISSPNDNEPESSSRSYKKELDSRQKITIESRFSPSALSIEHSTIYKIVLNGTQQNPIFRVPKVPGLKISNNPDVVRAADFIKGVPHPRISLSFKVQPEEVGTFTIPSWNLLIEGKEIQVPATTLQVLASSQQEKQTQQHWRNAAFLDLDLPLSQLKIGTRTHCKLILYILDQHPVKRIEYAPKLRGGGFKINKLKKWNKEVKNYVIDDKSYRAFIWNLECTPLEAGNQEISFEVKLSFAPFNLPPSKNPFLNDPFFKNLRNKDKETKSNEISLSQIITMPPRLIRVVE